MVVSFYAKWCNACRALGPKVRRLPTESYMLHRCSVCCILSAFDSFVALTPCSFCRPQLSQMCNENPDIVMLKVDFDENRDVVKPLAIKVRCVQGPCGSVM